MAWRRMFLHIGTLAGCLAFLLTFWRAWEAEGWHLDAVLPASIRAVIAGGIVLVVSLVLLRLFALAEGAPPASTETPPARPALPDHASSDQ